MIRSELFILEKKKESRLKGQIDYEGLEHLQEWFKSSLRIK